MAMAEAGDIALEWAKENNTPEMREKYAKGVAQVVGGAVSLKTGSPIAGQAATRVTQAALDSNEGLKSEVAEFAMGAFMFTVMPVLVLGGAAVYGVGRLLGIIEED